MLLAVIALLHSLVFLGVQVTGWVIHGEWPEQPLIQHVVFNGTGLLGIDKVVHYLLDGFSPAGFLLLLGILLLWIWISVSMKVCDIEQLERERQRREELDRVSAERAREVREKQDERDQARKAREARRGGV